MRHKRTFYKPTKEGGSWFVVSTIYEPPRQGFVGSGIKYAQPYRTRAEARAFIRTLRK